ncbi:hypothetical protein [Chitinophaga sancti]|uniref:Uncharacterized protein n=1 Tax=Chitinophaga sancti TaxID=1004 RepID=A0A1K1NCS3_9BACT|nr:hypothetical protein [Chitinophaga sancti]WQD63330.1 hypothetical protein U0033_02905 [Chitinophaga sancti]WQG91044.1 hypothetical protein SR876_06010 [Chitinophaga sancti]SFW33143.1 hypothetical protein SAMN05661012_01198 [Chitinophaga sancti]
MKQLQRLILIFSCIFLPFVFGGVAGENASPKGELQLLNYKAPLYDHAYCGNLHFRATAIHKFNLRNRGLVDYDEYFLTISSIRIKPLFVYIHPQYRGYTESIISVSNSLSDWRGPPVA